MRSWHLGDDCLGKKKQNNSKMICVAILENKRKKFWGEISISFVWCSITLFPNPNYSLETEKYWLNRWIDLTYNISTTSTYFWLCTYRNLTMWGKLFQYFNIIFIEFHHVKIFCLISLCRAAGSPWKEWTGVPYLFTYKAHSVIRHTLNFRRRNLPVCPGTLEKLWQGVNPTSVEL